MGTGIFLVFVFFAADTVPPVVLAVIGVCVIAFVVATLVWIARTIRRSWNFTNYPKKWFRLSKFADENGLLYIPRSLRPELGGTVLSSSKRGVGTDRLIARGGRQFEIGNFDTLEQNVNTPVRYWGYMVIGLERRLPHIMLKSRHNAKKRRGIPGVVARDQAMSLEGDFDKYFTLYAPAQYRRDALYVFAPDLMALMIDEVSVLDVEIIDNSIFFYSPVAFDLTSRRTLRRLFRIARIVGAKTFRQTDRYWDDRGGKPFAANEVALPGRRLRQRASLVGAVFALIWIGLQIFRFVHGMG